MFKKISYKLIVHLKQQIFKISIPSNAILDLSFPLQSLRICPKEFLGTLQLITVHPLSSGLFCSWS